MLKKKEKKRKLSTKEQMFLNCGVGEDSDYKELKPVNPKGNQS